MKENLALIDMILMDSELALKWSPWRTVACWFLWRSIDPNVVVY